MTKFNLTVSFDTREELIAYLNNMSNVTSDESREAPEVTEAPEPKDRAITDTPEDRQEVSDVDADGLPYDPEIHADPPSRTADGLWRAKRGFSEKAKDARAKFKAAGGAIAAEADAVTEDSPAMPGAEETRTMPGVDAVESKPVPPISLGELAARTNELMQAGKLSIDRLRGLYSELGVTTPQVFETNETMRRSMWDALAEIA